jgi:hypothetical protein
MGLSDAIPGRYGKEALQEIILKLPHAYAVGLQNDRMIEQYRVIPDDTPLDAFVREKVISPAVNRAKWEPEACWVRQSTAMGLKSWPEWLTLDQHFMQHALEPCLYIYNHEYQFDGDTFYLCEIRFMPQRSYEHKADG